jgi:micrococcal nuclease
MKQTGTLLLIAYMGFVAFGCNSRSSRRSGKSEARIVVKPSLYPVAKIIDGDTFWVDDGAAGFKVRLIGVNAPESRNVFRKKVGYYGKEAKEYVFSMLTDKKVKLVCDVDSLDQYGRTLAYVYLEDGTFVNAHLVEAGFAMVMTVPPNVKFADEFVYLQREAREHSRGLWRDTTQNR